MSEQHMNVKNLAFSTKVFLYTALFHSRVMAVSLQLYQVLWKSNKLSDDSYYKFNYKRRTVIFNHRRLHLIVFHVLPHYFVCIDLQLAQKTCGATRHNHSDCHFTTVCRVTLWRTQRLLASWQSSSTWETFQHLSKLILQKSSFKVLWNMWDSLLNDQY